MASAAYCASFLTPAKGNEPCMANNSPHHGCSVLGRVHKTNLRGICRLSAIHALFIDNDLILRCSCRCNTEQWVEQHHITSTQSTLSCTQVESHSQPHCIHLNTHWVNGHFADKPGLGGWPLTLDYWSRILCHRMILLAPTMGISHWTSSVVCPPESWMSCAQCSLHLCRLSDMSIYMLLLKTPV